MQAGRQVPFAKMVKAILSSFWETLLNQSISLKHRRTKAIDLIKSFPSSTVYILVYISYMTYAVFDVSLQISNYPIKRQMANT